LKPEATSNASSPGWRPSAAAAAKFGELIGKSIKLPSVPALYYQVVTELESPRGSIDFVARLVAKDPALCARILQTVNSATFAPGQRITSAHEAVLFLGAERIKAIILFEETVAPLKNTVWPGFCLSELWRHSMSVAGLATKIARMEKVGPEVGDMGFTAGILHDLGKLVFLANMPAQYAKALDHATRQKVPLKDAEEQVLGVNHADLGGLLLESWALPQDLINAVGWHHQPSLSGGRVFSSLTAVHVADVIDHELHRSTGHAQQSAIDREHIAAIGLNGRCDSWRAACGCVVTPKKAAA